MCYLAHRSVRNLMTGKRYAFVLTFILLAIGCLYLISSESITCESSKLFDNADTNEIPVDDKLNILKKKWIDEYIKNQQSVVVDEPPHSDERKSNVAPVECYINDEYAVQCLRETEGQEMVYMPFDFLQNYFEVYGKMKHYDGYDRFEFLQSFAKVVYKPKTPYTFKGTFMTFDTYNVEVRDRVKCISGVQGVPVSTQWGPKGYFYPIQIAQFGLSHYSKNLMQKPPDKTVYEDGEAGLQVNWKTSNRHCKVEIAEERSMRTNVVKISTPESIPIGNGVSLILGNTMEHVLSFDLKFLTNGSISVFLDTNDKTKQFKVHYITNSLLMDFDRHNDIFYGIGPSTEWRRMARDLLIDLRKGVGMTNTKQTKKTNIAILKVSRIVVRGDCLLDNITLSSAQHMDNFADSVRWLRLNQDPVTGGWKNEIERRMDGFGTLAPGWLSAMAQGQAMSVLARAFHRYNDTDLVRSLALAALPLTRGSRDGGVRAVFLDKYVWYEEYPTTPSLFVLNGFVYSLIGLYDFKSLLEDQMDDAGRFRPGVADRFAQAGVDAPDTYRLVSELYQDGMASLAALLPLFDGGSRSFYDLRHFVLKQQPNVARWDYHATHLSQLALLSTISAEPVFKDFFNYWTAYTKGKVAKHN